MNAKKNIVLSDEEFLLFQKFFVEQSGLYFDKDRVNSLESSLKKRVEEKGHNTYMEYYNFLKFHPEGKAELKELFDLVTIGETFFFRNSPQFNVLAANVLPEIIRRKREKGDFTIRIWSAGCSKGDEPYSIAITIMENLPDYMNWNISILGTEINRNVLACAREGVYTKKDVGSMPVEYVTRYFDMRGSNFMLNDKVKKLVRFEYHNLSKDAFGYEPMQQLDIIFCRNVIIYFKLDTIKKIMNNFYDCLIPNGYLFLGHSETLWNISNRFETIEFPKTFIYRKPLEPINVESARPFIEVPRIDFEDLEDDMVVPGAVVDTFVSDPGKRMRLEDMFTEKELGEDERKEVNEVIEKAIQCFDERKYDEAEELVTEILRRDPKNIKALYIRSNVYANCGRYYEAIDVMKNILKVDNLHLESYYMLGVMASKMTDYDNAKKYFQKVIYVDAKLELAHYNLANIYMYEKKNTEASKYFNNALRILEKREPDADVRFGEDFTVDFLIRACRNHLDSMNKEG